MPEPNGRQIDTIADTSMPSSRLAVASLRNLGALTFFRARDAADRGVDSSGVAAVRRQRFGRRWR